MLEGSREGVRRPSFQKGASLKVVRVCEMCMGEGTEMSKTHYSRIQGSESIV